MTKYSKDSEYNKYPNPPKLTSDKITDLGMKRNYSEIATTSLIAILAILILALVFAGLGMGFIGVCCVFGIQLHLVPTVPIISLVGSIASFIWFQRGWGSHFHN